MKHECNSQVRVKLENNHEDKNNSEKSELYWSDFLFQDLLEHHWRGIYFPVVIPEDLLKRGSSQLTLF